MILCNIGQDVTRIDAGILLALFVAFIIYTIVMAVKGKEFEENKGKTIVNQIVGNLKDPSE